MWNRNYRRWKRAAEAATAPHLYAEEQEKLSREIAHQVWGVLGAPGFLDSYAGNAGLAMEIAVASMLTETVLMTSLSLRHLDHLESCLDTSEYEDVPGLRAEIAWTAVYLSGQLRHVDTDEPVVHLLDGERPARDLRSDHLSFLLAGRMAAVLCPSAVAA